MNLGVTGVSVCVFTCPKTKEVHSFSPTKSLKSVFTYFLEVGADPACVHLSGIALGVNKPQRGPVLAGQSLLTWQERRRGFYTQHFSSQSQSPAHRRVTCLQFSPAALEAALLPNEEQPLTR